MSSNKPRTLRGGLLRSLLVALAVLLASSALLIDLSVDRELLTRFDAELLAEARTLQVLTQEDASGVSVHTAEAALRAFSTRRGDDVFELRDAAGKTLQRSRSLGENHLPRRAPAPDGKPVFSDLRFPDGREGRVVWLSFTAGASEALTHRPALRPDEGGEVVLALGHPTGLLSAAGLQLDLILVSSVISILGLLGLFVWRSVGKQLEPLELIAEQARLIGLDPPNPALQIDAAPAELHPLVDRVNLSTARLTEALERERRWSRDLAHELRTPLAELKALVEVAAQFPQAHQPIEVYREAGAIAAEMERLVGTLLLLARIEGGLELPQCRSFDLVEMVENLPTGEAVVRLPTDLFVHTDPALLRIVLSNLIGNALSHADRSQPIVIAGGIEPQGAWLEIRNHAPNLAPEDLAQIPLRFWRKNGVNSGSGHAGLGLSLAFAVCKALQIEFSMQVDLERQLSVRLSGLQIPLLQST